VAPLDVVRVIVDVHFIELSTIPVEHANGLVTVVVVPVTEPILTHLPLLQTYPNLQILIAG
jgi:hypothetical protein